MCPCHSIFIPIVRAEQYTNKHEFAFPKKNKFYENYVRSDLKVVTIKLPLNVQFAQF